jgi:hypothetical protein
MVIDLTPLLMRSARDSVIGCVELGRELGRQGLTSVVNGLRVYVPVTGTRKVMESMMRTGPFAHIAHEFVPGEQVVFRLQPSDAKRLFAAPPRQAAPGRAAPGRAAPGRAAPRAATRRRAPHCHPPPRDAPPRDAPPRDAPPRDAPPRDVTR